MERCGPLLCTWCNRRPLIPRAQPPDIVRDRNQLRNRDPVRPQSPRLPDHANADRGCAVAVAVAVAVEIAIIVIAVALAVAVLTEQGSDHENVNEIGSGKGNEKGIGSENGIGSESGIGS